MQEWPAHFALWLKWELHHATPRWWFCKKYRPETTILGPILTYLIHPLTAPSCTRHELVMGHNACTPHLTVSPLQGCSQGFYCKQEFQSEHSASGCFWNNFAEYWLITKCYNCWSQWNFRAYYIDLDKVPLTWPLPGSNWKGNQQHFSEVEKQNRKYL